jgi:hypothetical protein
MEEAKFLDGYSGQSVDELISLEGEYRVDSLVLAFEQAIQQKAAQIGVGGLSDEERIVLAVEALEREVNNGGYDQFFRNASKEWTPFVVEALRRIGCPQTAETTQQASAALGIAARADVEAIDAVMSEDSEARDQTLSDCDGAYYQSSEDIAGRLFAFIKARRNHIAL